MQVTPTSIASADEFVALRTSPDHDRQRLAATLPAPEAVWLAVIDAYPDMRLWVAQNKTVPLAVLRRLAADPDADVRRMVAMKRKCDAELFGRLAADPDPNVRVAVALNPKAPEPVLRLLQADPWERIREVVARRLDPPGD